MLSDCLSKLIPWNKTPAAVMQSHPDWDGGGDGLGGSWEAPPALQSGICQELEVPRAPEDLQVGMLVWSSPVAVVSITSGSREPSEVLPKLRHPQEKPWEGKSSCSRLFQLLALGSLSPEEFPGPMQCWISRSAQENSRCVFLSSPALCSVLRAGVVFTGTSPSYSWFPSLPHAHPGIPWGKNPL